MITIVSTLMDALFESEGALLNRDHDAALVIIKEARQKGHEMVEAHLNHGDKEKEKWLSFVYAMKPEEIHRMIYHMYKMDYPELNALISAAITYEEPYHKGGFCMPRWMSTTDGFSMYGRQDTILKFFPLYNGKKLAAARLIIADIDDGANWFDLECHGHDPVADEHMVNNIIRIFREEFENKPILDVTRLLEMTEQYGFKRV